MKQNIQKYDAAFALEKIRGRKIGNLKGYVNKQTMPDGNLLFCYPDFSRIYVYIKKGMAIAYVPSLPLNLSLSGKRAKLKNIPVKL